MYNIDTHKPSQRYCVEEIGKVIYQILTDVGMYTQVNIWVIISVFY